MLIKKEGMLRQGGKFPAITTILGGSLYVWLLYAINRGIPACFRIHIDYDSVHAGNNAAALSSKYCRQQTPSVNTHPLHTDKEPDKLNCAVSALCDFSWVASLQACIHPAVASLQACIHPSRVSQSLSPTILAECESHALSIRQAFDYCF